MSVILRSVHTDRQVPFTKMYTVRYAQTGNDLLYSGAPYDI